MREVVDAAHNGFVCVDADSRVVYMNPRAEAMFGRTVEGAAGIELSELLTPADYQRAQKRVRRLEAGELPEPAVWGGQMTAVAAGGGEFPIEVTVMLGPAEAGCAYLVWLEDVTERSELLNELANALRGGSPGLAEILDSIGEAVTIRDPHHHIIYANQAAIEHMGFSSLDELQRRPPQAIFDDYIVLGENGEPLTMEDIPSVRLLAGQQPEPLLMQTVHRQSGAVKWQLLKSTLLRDDAGAPAATVTVIDDVTAEKATQRREHFLARATDTLISSLDYEETLRNVAWLAVPAFADWCAIELVEAGVRNQIVVAHPDPAKLELADRLRRYEPDKLDPDSGVGRVMATGTSELYPEIPDQLLAEAAQDEEHLQLMRSLAMRSAIAVPLRARGRIFGVMTLITGESLRRFDHSDLAFAEQLAGRAAIAVDNARLATELREIADTLQRSLLPDADPAIEGWDVATMYRPAGTSDEVEVGGDFYDFIETPAGWLVLLGDVTGRGVQAASMTALVRHGARFLAKDVHSPAEILARLDQALREERSLSLCSALCVRLERERLVMSSAGHPAPLIARDDGRIREIGTSGPLLGGWTGSSWTDRILEIGANETFVMYTDGVTDTRGPSERFGPDRLRRVLVDHAGQPPAELLAALKAELDGFQVEGQSDDTGAVALRPVPVQTPVPTLAAAYGRRSRGS
jgi:PAS domain S-box-containing protein